MGHTYTKIKVYNRDLSRFEEVSLLVDTGSTYSWISRDRLVNIGVVPVKVRKFKTIDGKSVEREIGEAVIECMEERGTTVVVFAEKGDSEVLGVLALEGLALEINPLTEELKKTEALLAV
ncbi:MAG: hypothetical protein AB1393_06710 [Candidatus Edwardsbacteria bacterium]